MQSAPSPSAATLAPRKKKEPQFPPLEHVTRPAVDTAAAAHYLSRKPQTLRGWACLESGPIRPLHVHGRLAWPVSELKRVLGMLQ
jgi:hypothetical protein